MKVKLKNSLINNIMLDNYSSKFKQKKAEINTEQNYNNERPARAISFGGSAVSLGQKIIQNKTLNKVTDFVWSNEAAFTAIYSLGLAGIVKPLLILNQKKGSEEKDRQIIATKNFLQAFIGSFMSLTIGGGIIKKAVDIVKNDLKLIDVTKDKGTIKLNTVKEDSEHALEVARNLIKQEHKGISYKLKQASNEAKNQTGLQKIGAYIKGFFKKINYNPSEAEIKVKAKETVNNFKNSRLKIFEKNSTFVNKIIKEELPDYFRKGSTTTLYEAFESFWKNSTGWITAILKAKISSLLLPGVMAFLFTKNAIDKNKSKNENYGSFSPLLNNQNFKKENEKFKVALSKKTTPINFTGKVTNTIATGLANLVERASMTKVGEKLVSALGYFKKPSARMADLESILLTTYWLHNTSNSKKIEPDQKLGLNIQTALVTIVSSLTAALIDKVLDKPMKKLENSYGEVLEANISSIKDELKNGKAISNLQGEIKEKCSNLAGASAIAKKLVKTDLYDESAVKEAVKELTQSYGKKLSKLKSLTIFTLIVRLIIPVLMVPVGGKLKNKLKEFKARIEKDNKDNK